MSFPSAEAICSFPKLLDIDMELTRGMPHIALYTLVALPDPSAFLQAVNKDEHDIIDDDTVRWAPDHDFSSRTLADIVEYHLTMFSRQQVDDTVERKQHIFDYSLFIVAVHEDHAKHGVLVANMVYEFYSNLEAVPALARCPVYHEGLDENTEICALSWCINLQIANMDMYDLLEQDSNMSWPAPLPGYAELQEDLKHSCQELKQKATEKYSTFPIRNERYIVHLIGDPHHDSGTQKYSVEPDAFFKESLELVNRVATTRGLDARFNKGTVDELWTQIRESHPGRCQEQQPRKEPCWTVHKYWMFVIDKPDTEDNAVALVKAHWDGVTDGRSKEELEMVMPELEIVARCGPAQALAHMDKLSVASAVATKH